LALANGQQVRGKEATFVLDLSGHAPVGPKLPEANIGPPGRERQLATIKLIEGGAHFETPCATCLPKCAHEIRLKAKQIRRTPGCCYRSGNRSPARWKSRARFEADSLVAYEPIRILAALP